MRRRYEKRYGKRLMALGLAAAMSLSMAACGEKGEGLKEYEGEKDYTSVSDSGKPILAGNVKEEDITAAGAVINSADCYTSDEGCEEAYYTTTNNPDYPDDTKWNMNEFSSITENPFVSVKTSPLSTFAADVDTASYTTLRKQITSGSFERIDKSAIRIEEMINYFKYDYETPKNGEKFAVVTEYADCPWNEDTKLALVAMNTEAIDFSESPASNLVFLVDVSGSMFNSDKLPLVQKSLCMLAENLTEKDKISIVTYAGEDAVVLEGVTGDHYTEICSAVEALEAGGSTNGAAGINTAYKLAEKYYIQGGNNRVILATDGDLNVGVTSESALEELITEKKETGVFLSVLGFGYGNYKDNKLETLADKGNGNYSYIDSTFEAKRALVDNMGANLVTVAKDVKLQVEFNPALVKGYRLIGYENRQMAAEDFNDDTKDGGEMGAGHTVTAIYEIVPADSKMEIGTSDLKYQTETTICDDKTELFTVNIRYKEPEGERSELKSFVCTDKNYSKEGSDNLRFAAAVAGFGMLVKDSEYKGTVDKNMIKQLATGSKLYETNEYAKEFVELVDKWN